MSSVADACIITIVADGIGSDSSSKMTLVGEKCIHLINVETFVLRRRRRHRH
jgi:hypothetical protein